MVRTIKSCYLKVLFYITTIVSVFIWGILYDSTSGIDYGFYLNSVQFFSNNSELVLDSQGSLYFYTISKFLNIILVKNSGEITNFQISLVIQIVNYLYYLFGLVGIYQLMIKKGFEKNQIYLSLLILNFFPPTIYLRLTMKPEILAFALLPWSIYFLEHYFESKDTRAKIIAISLTSILLTQKASIFAMVLLSLIYIFWIEVKNFRKNIGFFTLSFLTTLFLLYENFKVFNIWLFEKNLYLSEKFTFSNWDNVAPKSFFYNFDLKNLIENPFKFVHSDSLISITLLDTLSDYFGFFWNHYEAGNLIAFNRTEFTDNFLIQKYLPMYFSIIFSVAFYLLIIIMFFISKQHRGLLLLPFIGIFILSINSIGVPSNNFDPLTGDTFKVHYYSFLLSISFFYLVLLLISFLKKYSLFTLILIPVFLITMGFPKTYNEEYAELISNKINFTQACFLSYSEQVNCSEFYDLEINPVNIYAINSGGPNLMLTNLLLILNVIYFYKFFHTNKKT